MKERGRGMDIGGGRGREREGERINVVQTDFTTLSTFTAGGEKGSPS